MPDPIQPASTKVLSTEFKLGFDPLQPDDPIIKQIFESKSARALWLFIRRDHLASQHFNEDALTASRRFDRLQPQTLDEFRQIFHCLRDPAVASPWNERYGDEEASRQRAAKLSFLMEAMYGRIELTISIK